ncbi:MAG TPA: metal-sulfur cluster assembly factor [Caldisericia bacterium]|nr:metal-sulfur cluster assembly factor [Caldisericia bacterium]HOW03341.1 metal-sulfur cluster assembly factor [Caldisericia bacterium]
MVSEEKVREALKAVLDPEIGMSVIDLNMIKNVEITDEAINIDMVLTIPGCPLASYMVNDVKRKTEEISEGRKVNVKCLDEQWVPPWSSSQP